MFFVNLNLNFLMLIKLENIFVVKLMMVINFDYYLNCYLNYFLGLNLIQRFQFLMFFDFHFLKQKLHQLILD